MDYAFQGRHPPSELAAMVSQSNNLQDEDEWLVDSGANTHITNDLENLTLQQPYQGDETVAVGNGSRLGISHTGSSSFLSSNQFLHLKNILHCSDAKTNLLSINKFCRDNDFHFKLIDTYFLIKDNLIGRILLQGANEDGLYPLRLQHFTRNKVRAFTARIGIKVSSSVWHNYLGHPSHQILQHLLHNYYLLVSSVKSNQSICVSCQLGNSKKLPFAESSRVTIVSLELIHSDVWNSPLSSINGSKCYVIFIDDFSRHTLLFPLKLKSDVFETFVKFKCLIENLFSFKIKQLQIDGGGECTSHNFTKFMSTHGILH